MISRLNNGDILLTCDLPEMDAMNPGQMVEIILDVEPDHGMIFKDERVYHASSGDHQSGVRSHAIKKAILPGYDITLGVIQILECKDENLRQRFVDTMARWDPVDFLKQLPRQPGHVKLPTKFLDFQLRKLDPKEQAAKCEFYRALRAYQRNHVKPPQPLSVKGISCGNFIAYSFKAAIVDLLFPQGFPSVIAEKLQQIEAVKQKDKLKLFEVAEKTDLLDELMQLVEQHLLPTQFKHFKFLKIPVQGTSVFDFCVQALNYPDFWKFKGYMFYLHDDEETIPRIMSDTTLETLYIHHAKKGQPVTIDLSRKDFTDAEIDIVEVAPAQKDEAVAGVSQLNVFSNPIPPAASASAPPPPGSPSGDKRKGGK